MFLQSSGCHQPRISCRQFLRQRRRRRRRRKASATPIKTNSMTRWRHDFVPRRRRRRRRHSSNFRWTRTASSPADLRCAPDAACASSTSSTSAPWRPNGTRRVSSAPTAAWSWQTSCPASSETGTSTARTTTSGQSEFPRNFSKLFHCPKMLGQLVLV